MTFVDAYDKRTGKKLEHRVPESHLRIFSSVLSKTPRQKSSETKTAPAVKTPSTRGENKGENHA